MERNGAGFMSELNFRRQGKTVIGLTGAISGGKSTALQVFEESGAEVICSDKLSRKYFDICKQEIYERFKSLGRTEIAETVFKDDTKRKWLENLLHPLIFKEALEIISASNKKIIVFDVPLLFETGLENSFDLTICIYTDDKIRLKRALEKGFKKEDFLKRDLKQMPLEQKAQKAERVIYNNSDRKTLEEKIKRFFYILNIR